MRFGWICFVMTLLLSSVVSAQEEAPAYRLRVPTAEEYFSSLPGISNQMKRQIDTPYDRNYQDLLDTFRWEMMHRYPNLDGRSFDTLYHVYEVLEPVNFYLSRELDTWPELLVIKWLRETNIDLSENQQLEFEDFFIHVSAVDFDGDSNPEYVLEITSKLYSGFWVMAGNAGNYHRIETPLPDYAVYCPLQVSCGGNGALIGIEDVNADGLPEMLVSHGSCGYGICGASLFILGWRDGQMTELIPRDSRHSPYWTMASGGGGVRAEPPEGTWTFENMDDDPARELVQQGQIEDNRGCAITLRQVFDWDTVRDAYIAGKETEEHAPSAGCTLLRGHTALLVLDYSTAVEAYQDALRFLSVNGDEYEQEARQYAQLRLALAYALAGQSDEAFMLLTELDSQTIESAIMRDLIANAMEAYRAESNSVALCAALYQTIADFEYWNSDDRIVDFGQTNTYNVPFMYTGGDFSPAATGCNLESLLTEYASDLTTTDKHEPPVSLQVQGWDVIAEFHNDLNGDRIDDWIIWVNPLANRALLLLSNDTLYIVTQPYFPIPDEDAEYHTIALPGNVGKALLRFGYDPERQSCSDGQSYRFVELLRMNQGALSSIGRYDLCGEYNLTHLFPVPEELHAWKQVYEPDGVSSFVETIYHWDVNQMSFVLQSELEPTPEVQTETDLFSCGLIGEEFCGFYKEGNEGLAILDAVLAEPPEFADSHFLVRVHYYRALALEALNRPDEALAEYVAIYEAAPESAWGQLAALHLERVEP